MATLEHTPRGKGYDYAVSYFHHMVTATAMIPPNEAYPGQDLLSFSPKVSCTSRLPLRHSTMQVDYWMNWFENPNGDTSFFPECEAKFGDYRPVDLWRASPDGEGPARGLNNTAACSVGAGDICKPSPRAKPGSADNCQAYPGQEYPGTNSTAGAEVPGCSHLDKTLTDQILAAIARHDPAQPLFLFWAPHTVHTPLQVPRAFLDRFGYIDRFERRRYHAMVAYMDSLVGSVVAALKEKGMWDNLLWVTSSDNGGPVYAQGTQRGMRLPVAAGISREPVPRGSGSSPMPLLPPVAGLWPIWW